ncbi:MAG TPA: ribokinase [Opitutae bacterium]|nr:ribokinase [Opitutae bacterium]|tara:strand:+ start:833 stop:1786 length:954 start_codon:yes stop_codon:yes gene_type:complete
MAADIVVIGSYNQDFVWKADRFPKPGETIPGTFATGPGGKGSNQAIAAARSGASTAFVGAVGNDTLGENAQALHKREGIESHLAIKTQAPTGSAAIIVDATGQNQIIGDMGANLELQEADVPESLLRKALIVLAQPESNPATIRATLHKAHELGKITILNPAPIAENFDISILNAVDILIPNELEFATLVRLTPACRNPKFSTEDLFTLNDAALHNLCRSLGVATVIITLGNQGCFLSEKNGHRRFSIYHGLPVVDTTGAGDAFIGAFSSGLIQFNNNIPKAIQFASIAAALAVSKSGAAAAMPKAEDIQKHLSLAF